MIPLLTDDGVNDRSNNFKESQLECPKRNQTRYTQWWDLSKKKLQQKIKKHYLATKSNIYHYIFVNERSLSYELEFGL